MNDERRMAIACAIGCLLIALFGAARAEPKSEEEKSEAILETCVYAGFVALPLVAVVNNQGWLPEFAPLHQYEWDRLAEDKRRHIAVEAKIGFGVSAFLFTFMPDTSQDYHRWALAGGSCMAIGVAKETYDEAEFHAGYRPEGGDYEDLVADAAGCAGGVVVGAALGTATRLSMGIVIGADGGEVLIGRTF